MISSLKELRTSAGFSQVRLANESKVSLPTIQNIEAKKANPTIDILEKIYNTLGIELVLKPMPINLEKAIILGVPLLCDETFKSPLLPSIKILKEETIKWHYALLKNNITERERLSLIGFLMAIKDHYPLFFQNEINFPIFEKLISEYRNNGKVIKLRRLSLAKVSKYL